MGALLSTIGSLLSMGRVTSEEYDPPLGRPFRPLFRPFFLYDLPREDLVRLQRQVDDRRFLFQHRHRRPHRGIEDRRPEISEEERDASIIHLVRDALRHYNANNPGAEFDLVKPLMAAHVGFRREIWCHVSFLARRRNTGSANASPPAEPGDSNVKQSRKRSSRKCRSKAARPETASLPSASGTRQRPIYTRAGSPPEPTDTPGVKHFFAELHYDRFRTPVVQTCTIIEKSPGHFKTRCAFCPGSFEILHPSDGNFVCGKKGQEKKYFRMMNLLEKPFTCPSGEAGNGPRPLMCR